MAPTSATPEIGLKAGDGMAFDAERLRAKSNRGEHPEGARK
jgi:hypothetical protein